MKLALPRDLSMEVTFSSYSTASSGAINWIGSVTGDPEALFSLSVVADVVDGYVLSEQGEFQFSGPRDGQLVLEPLNLPNEFCGTCSSMGEELAGFGENLEELPFEDSQETPEAEAIIDILVVYTPLALQEAGSLAALLAKANLMINSFNNLMSSSGADARANLMGIAPVSHPAAGASSDGSSSTLFNRLRNTTDGQLDEAHDYRDTYGADMVCAFGKVTAFGVGSIGGAWSAADYSTASGVMPHELGHNLGCGHNDIGGSGQTLLPGVYPYSSAHFFNYNGQQRGTIMSYIGSRMPRFSNPDRTWNGIVTGTTTRDHARTISTFAPAAAAWRSSDSEDYDRDGIPNDQESGSADADGDGLPDILDPDNTGNGPDPGIILSAPYYDLESDPGDDSIVRNLGTKVGYLTNGSWIRFGSVDFGCSGIESVEISAASIRPGGLVELRLGRPDGVLISTVAVGDTGGWNMMESFNAPMDMPVIGIHDLFLVFKGGNANLFDVESILLNKANPSVVLEAESATVFRGTVKTEPDTSGGRFVDGAGGFTIQWNVDVPAAVTRLDFRVRAPSGTRTMGVYVNGLKVGVITSSSATWETISGPEASMLEGRNSIELRDSEGSAELDVDWMAHFLSGGKLTQEWIDSNSGLLRYHWSGSYTLEINTSGLAESGWTDHSDGSSSPLTHSISSTPGPYAFFRLRSETKPAIGKSFTWEGGGENTDFKQVTSSVFGGVLSLNLDSENNDPYVRLKGANIDGDVFTRVQMRVRNGTGGTNWRIFFRPEGGIEGGNSIPMTVPASGEWRVVEVDMSTDPDYSGMIESIRIDQQSLSSGVVDIDYVRVISSP